jgi:hypothetical protein
MFAVAKPSARENFGGILRNDMARRSERLKGLFEWSATFSTRVPWATYRVDNDLPGESGGINPSSINSWR